MLHDGNVCAGRVSCTEELCGVGFSAATVSSLAESQDGRLEKFAWRRLEEEYPYLILDARYEQVSIDGTIQSQAVLIALGVGWDGRARCWPWSCRTVQVLF